MQALPWLLRCFLVLLEQPAQCVESANLSRGPKDRAHAHEEDKGVEHRKYNRPDLHTHARLYAYACTTQTQRGEGGGFGGVKGG